MSLSNTKFPINDRATFWLTKNEIIDFTWIYLFHFMQLWEENGEMGGVGR